MYRVVGCRNCQSLWTVEGRPETTQCPRCRTRHRLEMLRSFAETETSEAAVRVRSAMLAERADDGEFLDPEEIDVDAVGMDEVEFLSASGLDPDEIADAERRVEGSGRSRSRKQVVLDGLEELGEPTMEELIEYAAASSLERDFVERAIEKLRRAGEVTRTSEGYRKV